MSLLTRRATFAPSTFDATTGTVEATLSSGAGVQRRDARGSFSEVLSVAPGAFEAAARLPVLDSHRASSIHDIVGYADRITAEGGAIIARLTITSPTARALIETGTVTGVSIGYRVSDWSESTDGKTRTAVKWQLAEISLTAIPADPTATLRSSTPMEPAIDVTPPATPPPAPMQTRAQINAGIRRLGLILDLGTGWIDRQIDTGADLAAVRSAALTEIESRSAAGTFRVHQVGQSADDPAVRHSRMAEAMAHRMAPGLTLSEPARQYRDMGLVDHARAALVARGETGVSYMSRETIITRSITTGDLPHLLVDSGNRVLAAAYQAAPNPLRALARQTTAVDFRTRSVLRLGEMSLLERVAEDGEVTAGGVGEAKESYALATYAKTFSLTRQALINDDLGAFAGLTAAMGRAAAETEAGLLVKLLTQGAGAGPMMADGVRLFNAAHGNLAATGSSVNVDGLSDARLAMRLQRGVDGKTPINATAKYLVVSPAMETLAESMIGYIYSATPEAVNPFTATLTVVVEPRLTGNSWYVFADPAVLPILEYAYLASAPGPQLESRPGWDVLGMEFRCLIDFGCGAIDWRGAYRNAGA